MFKLYSDIEWQAVEMFRDGMHFDIRSESDSNYQTLRISSLGFVLWLEHKNLHVGNIKFVSALDGSVSGGCFRLCNWEDGCEEDLIGFYMPEKGVEKRHLQVYFCRGGKMTDDYVIYCTDAKEASLNEVLENARR